MKSYSLKCRNDIQDINPNISKTSKDEQWYYQIVQYVIVKNQDLIKIKRQKDY